MFWEFFLFFSDFHSGLSDSALYNTALSLLYVYNAYTNDGTPGWLTYSQSHRKRWAKIFFFLYHISDPRTLTNTVWSVFKKIYNKNKVNNTSQKVNIFLSHFNTHIENNWGEIEIPINIHWRDGWKSYVYRLYSISILHHVHSISSMNIHCHLRFWNISSVCQLFKKAREASKFWNSNI